MFIGVISDTHGHLWNTREAARLLVPFAPELVIHCGDVGNPRVVEPLAPWKAHYVLGNVDDDEPLLCEMVAEAGHTFHGRIGKLELAGRKIAFLHSDDHTLFRQTIDSGEFDLVCYGHTHQAEQHREGNTLVLNPGAVYRANPHSIAIVELPSLDVTRLEF